MYIKKQARLVSGSLCLFGTLGDILFAPPASTQFKSGKVPYCTVYCYATLFVCLITFFLTKCTG